MSGVWRGGAANRRWERTGNHNSRADRDDQARGERLWELLKDEIFYCDCGGSHPLWQVRECRARLS